MVAMSFLRKDVTRRESSSLSACKRYNVMATYWSHDPSIGVRIPVSRIILYI
jgi:hypothetical protein